MPIIKCSSQIEVYRHKARSKDINELSGRTGRPDRTRFVSEMILQHLPLTKTDVFVDLGCGDGTLLKLVSGKVGAGIGLLPTEEEIDRVRADLAGEFPQIEIRKGLVQCTGLEAGVADKIVCNSVFLLLAEKEVDGALQEMVRISKPGASIFIGEVPMQNEFQSRSYGDSIIRWLWWVLKTQGMMAFFGRLRQLQTALFSSEPFIIGPKTLFHEAPEQFVKRAQRAGLSLEAQIPHLEKADDGTVRESETRLDYLFHVARMNTESA